MMRLRRAGLAAAASLLALAMGSGAGAAPAALAATSCPLFPANNYWHTAVASLPVNPNSATWIANMTPTARLHPDFGDFSTQGYGIPVNYVASAHSAASYSFQYGSQSDPGPYVTGTDLRIEGGPVQPAGGDQHMLAVNTSSCQLQELWHARSAAAPYTAGSGAKWGLWSNALRPDGWTSADAAGLPILPGLVRFDEVTGAGVIDHAIRFTVNRTDQSHIWPARHDAGAAADHTLPPMGARFRLRASFDISHFDAAARVVLVAMKTYGLVLADNGSDWFFSGTSDDRWAKTYINGNSYSDQLTQDFRGITGSAFEAVDTSPLMISPASGATAVSPYSVTASAGAGRATVSWRVPTTNAQNPIDHYMVLTSPGGAQTRVAAGATSTTITGLTPGTAYTFAVLVVLRYGNASLWSIPSGAVTPT